MMTTAASLLTVLTIAAGCNAVAPTEPSANEDTSKAVVLKTIDGDTVDIRRGDSGAPERVRILGIDTPEVFGGVECWGREASEFAKTRLTNAAVSVQSDPTQPLKDRFGRTLAYLVFSDGSDYSIIAAEAGMARSYIFNKKPVSKHNDIATAELRASAEHRGLWGACPREN